MTTTDTHFVHAADLFAREHVVRLVDRHGDSILEIDATVTTASQLCILELPVPRDGFTAPLPTTLEFDNGLSFTVIAYDLGAEVR